jgi:hypothetical protein
MKGLPMKSVKPLPDIDGILVHCAHDRLVPLKDIKPNPRNYNKHPEAQIDLLAKNIKAVGWRHPITVSKLSGLIVAGHARYEAAQKLGLSCAPVNFQAFKNVSEELAVMVADNRLAELAEPDMPALKDMLLELDTGAMDIELTGFDEKAMEDLMTELPPDKDHDQVYAQMELQPHEHYDYLIVLADNEQDFQWLLDRLKITKCQDAKKAQSIGLGRAITAARLIKELDK